MVLVSGAYQPVLDAFARRIDAEAIGTPLELRHGRATGRLAGPVNNDRVEVATLRPLLGDNALFVAYGDTPADVPMLELSAMPIVVGCNAQLLTIAAGGGWRRVAAGGPRPAATRRRGYPSATGSITRRVPDGCPPYEGEGAGSW